MGSALAARTLRCPAALPTAEVVVQVCPVLGRGGSRKENCREYKHEKRETHTLLQGRAPEKVHQLTMLRNVVCALLGFNDKREHLLAYFALVLEH